MQTNAPQGQIVNQNIQPQQVMTQPVTQPRVAVQQPVVQTTPLPQGQQFAGVNIQIFNPSVGAPGAAPVYNVNAPSYGTGLGSCYPSGYYTEHYGPQNTQTTTNNTNGQNTTNGSDGANGNNGTDGTNGNGANGSDGTNGTNGSNGNNGTNGNDGKNGTSDNNGKDGSNTTNTTTNKTINETENKTTDKKVEKRQIVRLTDNYIRTLENYLNSQDYEVRLMGAKEVVARAQEDPSRKDDKALIALTNKMLQDPAQQIRILAQSLLESRAITGDDYTVGVLQKMQNSKDGYGQDALSATNILLKMSGQTVEKEFEVNDKQKKTEEKKS